MSILSQNRCKNRDEINSAWGDWDSRRSVITASRSDYDIIFGDLKVYTQDVKNGNAMPLDEFLKKDLIIKN